jgi:hypothetical protein
MVGGFLGGTPLYLGAVHLFACRILHERELNITHLLGFEGAIGSAP